MTRRPFVIGVTGNIACGKSTVMATLAELGAQTIDADRVYHRLIEPDAPLWHAVRNRFGQDLAAPGEPIDRRALGALVFNDPAALAALDALTHPAITEAIRREIAASLSAVVAVDAVKLVESGFAAECDAIWLVTCRPDLQVERLIRRNGLDRGEATRRVAAQPSVETKRAIADVVIDNSGSLDETRQQVLAAWSAARRRLDTSEKIV